MGFLCPSSAEDTISGPDVTGAVAASKFYALLVRPIGWYKDTRGKMT